MASPKRRSSSPRRDARSAVRRKTALALRVEGCTLAQIGAKLGITKQSVHKQLEIELSEVAAERKDLAEHQLAFELEQIDLVIRGMAPKTAQGDAKAGATLLRAMERRAKLLGLDAPDKHEHLVDVRKLSDAELDSEIARLAAEAGAAGDPSAGEVEAGDDEARRGG